MKIFFITPKLNFLTSGGSTDEYDLTYRTLMNLGHEVTVCTTYPTANKIPQELPYTVLEEDIHSNRQLGIQRGVLKILRKYSGQADFFFVDGQVYLYGAGLYRKRGGTVPVVAYFNRELPAWPQNVSYLFPIKKDSIFITLKQRLRFYVERYLLMPFANNIDVVCFSNSHLLESYRNFGMHTEGTSFIFGDPFDYRGNMGKLGITEDSYTKRNKRQGPFTIFYSSRMAPGKGFDLLLVAFSKLKNKEKFRLVLGGTGPEEHLVHRLVEDLHLQPYVEFPGWMTKDELYRRLRETDIFVQAHWRRDITSMSVMTALLFGLPSILPKGGGLEWIARGSALYFKEYDADDLASKIEHLGDEYELRATLSKHCYVRMDEPEMNHRNRIALLVDTMRRITQG